MIALLRFILFINEEYNAAYFLFIESVFGSGEKKKSITSFVTRWPGYEKHLQVWVILQIFLFGLAAVQRCLKYEGFSGFKNMQP